MRELVPRVYTTAADLRRKVFIIDEVQRIKEGWDVLLKTLEEPPEGVLFIFCTTDPSQIRPAVVSRLQRFTFRPLSQRGDRGQAAAHPRGRGPGRGRRTPWSSSPGSPRAACATPNRCSTRCWPRPTRSSTPIVVRDLLGLAPEDAVERFIDALADGDALAGIEVARPARGGGPGPGRVLGAGGRPPARTARGVRCGAGRRPARAALAAAARRLTGIDASRSGLGGYRWQLELALLCAAHRPPQLGPRPRRAAPASRAAAGVAATAAAARTASAPSRPRRRPRRPTGAAGQPRRRRARDRARVRRLRPAGGPAASRRPRPCCAGLEPAPADSVDLLARRPGRWPEIVAWIGRNPRQQAAGRRTAGPVEVRDGIVILGFPENQPFLREKAEQRRQPLEDGLAPRPRPARSGYAAWWPTSSWRTPAPRRGRRPRRAGRTVFGGELADVDDIG